MLFWQAMGLTKSVQKLRTRYFKMLDMPAPPEKGDYLISWDRYAATKGREGSTHPSNHRGTPRSLAGPIKRSHEAALVGERVSSARRMAGRQRKAAGLDRASVEETLSLRPDALRIQRRGNGDLGSSCPAPNQVRYAGRALVTWGCSNSTAASWTPPGTTCWRYRLLRGWEGQGPTLVEDLAAIAIDGLACAGDRAVLRNAKLDVATSCEATGRPCAAVTDAEGGRQN